MNHRSNCRVVAFVAVLAGVSAFAPTARAAISPTLSLDQSAGTKAGATLNLGLDLKFTDTGTDSPHDLAIDLPPGLLADASRDGGSCLKAANVSGTACEVGSGTVTATPDPIPACSTYRSRCRCRSRSISSLRPPRAISRDWRSRDSGSRSARPERSGCGPAATPRGSGYRSISYCRINFRSPCRWWGND